MIIIKEVLNMSINEWLTIIAIIMAPFLAIFAQRKLDEIRERRNQKLWVFRTLMATRANKISIEHVQALNSIELFFIKKGKEKKVIEKWGEYLNHLAEAPKEDDPDYKVKIESWTKKSDDFLANLLSLMGESLGYDFDIVKLKKGIYFPKGHGDIELDNYFIRKGMVGIMTGKCGFPVQQFQTINENKKMKE